jgi:1,5-anhydro-D-fructose reductase (1,5-anhydro-D-mannitol-forming)
MTEQGRPLGWGIIGASRIAAEFIVPEIAASAGGELVAVFSTDSARGAAFAAEAGIPKACTALDELLSEPGVDIVYVGTTNELHAAQTVAAAAAGKHVLCEKPLALTLDEADQMIDACRRAGVVLATNHHLRNAATHRAARRLIEDGSIGTPLFARLSMAVALPEPAHRWRLAGPGAGVTFDLTVHSADTVRFLLGAEVTEVVALTARHGLARAGDIEDGAMTILRLENGVLVSLHDAFTVPYGEPGFEVYGTEGTIVARNVFTQRPLGTVELRRGGECTEVDVGDRPSLYRATVERMQAAAQGDGDPVASGEDGRRSLQVALAVLQSARSGERVALR